MQRQLTSGKDQRLFLPKCSLLPEKFLKNGLTVFRHDAAKHCRLMVQANIGGQAEQRMTGARFGIGGSIDHSRNTSLHDRAGAHGARFQRHIQRAVEQSP